jgi:hypothetical protein
MDDADVADGHLIWSGWNSGMSTADGGVIFGSKRTVSKANSPKSSPKERPQHYTSTATGGHLARTGGKYEP